MHFSGPHRGGGGVAGTGSRREGTKSPVAATTFSSDHDSSRRLDQEGPSSIGMQIANDKLQLD